MRAPVLTLKRARKLRREMTLPEALLWERIRGGRLNGLRFQRQHPIGPYILEFYCALAHLAVEIDGAAHDHESRWVHDKRRDRWLGENRIRIFASASTGYSERRSDREHACHYRAGGRPLHHLRRSPSPALRAEEEPMTVAMCESRSPAGERG